MNNLLDLNRYPLHREGSPAWQSMVAQARADLQTQGMFNLDGFMLPAPIGELVAHLYPMVAEHAYTHQRQHNIYFQPRITDLPPDHPALREVQTTNHTLCADQLGDDCALLALYRTPAFARFLAAVMDKPALYVMNDPLASVNVMTYHAGEALNWHFDRSEFTITLLLQAPTQGGEFEYRSQLRSDSDPNYAGVARLLAGQDSEVKRLRLHAGTLNVFRGKNTAHRVTPVEGDVARMVAVLCYYERPGVAFSAPERLGFYGRTM